MAGSWRVAKPLIVLRDQLNALYPNRNKASDGTIGDAAHQATPSDHNPDANGVVKALDITHDPKNGLDIGQLFEQLRSSRDGRISYIIANKKIMVAPYWESPYPYAGSDPHTNHIHISVRGNFDDESKWKLKEEEVLLANKGDIDKFCRNVLRREPTKEDYVRIGWPYKRMVEDYVEGEELFKKINNWIARTAAAAELERERDKNLYPEIEKLRKEVKDAQVKADPQLASKLDKIKEILRG